MLLKISYKHKSLHLQLLFNCRAFSISVSIYMFTSIGRGTIPNVYTHIQIIICGPKIKSGIRCKIINKRTKIKWHEWSFSFFRIGCVCSFTHTTFQLTPREKCTNWHRNERNIETNQKSTNINSKNGFFQTHWTAVNILYWFISVLLLWFAEGFNNKKSILFCHMNMLRWERHTLHFDVYWLVEEMVLRPTNATFRMWRTKPHYKFCCHKQFITIHSLDPNTCI